MKTTTITLSFACVLFGLVLLAGAADAGHVSNHNGVNGCSRVAHTQAGGTNYYKVSIEASPIASDVCTDVAGYRIGNAGSCVDLRGDIATTGGPSAPDETRVYIFADFLTTDHGANGASPWISSSLVRTYTQSGTTLDGAALNFCATTDGTATGSPRAGTYRIVIRVCDHATSSTCAGNLYDFNSDPGSNGGLAGTGNTVGGFAQGGLVAGCAPTSWQDGFTAGGSEIGVYSGGDARAQRLACVEAISATAPHDVTLSIVSAAGSTLDTSVETDLGAGANIDATWSTVLTYSDAYPDSTNPTKRAVVSSNSDLLGEAWTYFVAAPSGATLTSSTQLDMAWGSVQKTFSTPCAPDNPTGAGATTTLMPFEDVDCTGAALDDARGDDMTSGYFRVYARRSSQAFGSTIDASSCDFTPTTGGAWTCLVRLDADATDTSGGALDYVLDFREYSDSSRTTVWNQYTRTAVFDVNDDYTATCPTLQDPHLQSGSTTTLMSGEEVECRDGVFTNARGEAPATGTAGRVYYRRASQPFGDTTDVNSCDFTTGALGSWACDALIKTTPATQTIGGALDYGADWRIYTDTTRATVKGSTSLAALFDVDNDGEVSPSAALSCVDDATTDLEVYNRGHSPTVSWRLCNARGQQVTPTLSALILTDNTGATEESASRTASSGVYTWTYQIVLGDAATATSSGQAKSLRVTWNGNTATATGIFGVSTVRNIEAIHTWKDDSSANPCSGTERAAFVMPSQILAINAGLVTDVTGQPDTFSKTFTWTFSGAGVDGLTQSAVTDQTSPCFTRAPSGSDGPRTITVVVTDAYGNTGTATKQVDFITPYTSPYALAVLGSELPTPPGGTFRMQVQVLKRDDVTGILEPYPPEDAPIYRINYTDEAGFWNVVVPTTSSGPAVSPQAYWINWTVPQDWPLNRSAILLVSANVSGVVVSEPYPLLIMQPGGGDPAFVEAAYSWDTRSVTITPHFSYLNGTGRCCISDLITVRVFDPDGEELDHGQTVTELGGEGSYFLKLYLGLAPKLGVWNVTAETPQPTNPDEIVSASALFVVTQNLTLRFDDQDRFLRDLANWTNASAEETHDLITEARELAESNFTRLDKMLVNLTSMIENGSMSNVTVNMHPGTVLGFAKFTPSDDEVFARAPYTRWLVVRGDNDVTRATIDIGGDGVFEADAPAKFAEYQHTWTTAGTHRVVLAAEKDGTTERHEVKLTIVGSDVPDFIALSECGEVCNMNWRSDDGGMAPNVDVPRVAQIKQYIAYFVASSLVLIIMVIRYMRR